MPDGRRFVVARMSDGRREWSASGALLAPDKSHFWDSAVFPNTATMGRPLRLKLTTTQSDTSGPQRLYDGEGWPLLRGVLTVVDAREEKYGFYGVVDRSVTTLSVTGAVPVGQYQTEYRLRRERSPSSTWSFWPEKEGLRVTFPGGMLDRFSGMDVQVRALDASGKVVTRPDGSQGYSLDPGWVEFQLPKPAADRVKSVEVSVRPYAWIRFPDVAMAPKASSPNVSSSR